ncbi:MAG: ABC transporter permease [Planctomycetota bacterium]|nr:ABC transporter permease [Planctomycetota bacterium]
MRPILLIALREFAENAKTKGFWIGLFLFPIIIFASIFVQELLEESTPTRNYVVVDQSGLFEEVIEDSMASMRRAELLRAIGEYQSEYAKDKPKLSDIDLEKVAAPDLMGETEAIEQATKSFGDELELLLGEQGLDAVLAQMKPLLVEDAPAFERPRPRFRRVALPEGIDASLPLTELAEELRPYLRGDRKVAGGEAVDGQVELFAAVLIPADIEQELESPGDAMAAMMAAGGQAEGAATERRGIQYWATNLADEDLKGRIDRAVTSEVHRKEYLARGMDAEQVADVRDIKVPLFSLNPNKSVGEEEVSMADKIRQWAPVGFVYLLWIAIFSISQMLLNNTIEEKSNRIIEVLLSSVTAGELMMGKLVGIACVGLVMITVWMGSLLTILKLSAGPEAEFPNMLLDVLQSGGLIPAFIIYFFLGYLLYSGLFLAIGSVCNTLKEAQNLMGPVMLIMMVPIITMMFIPKDPNGTLARILSWIPLYTPFTMMNRASADPPMVDVVGTLILLVAFTAFTLWAVGRIFRRGILRTGQPPKIRELFTWLRAE